MFCEHIQVCTDVKIVLVRSQNADISGWRVCVSVQLHNNTDIGMHGRTGSRYW